MINLLKRVALVGGGIGRNYSSFSAGGVARYYFLTEEE
jgi:hypothetical protein